jgi:hypothetical protein
MTLFCEKIITVQSKEVKTRCNLAESSKVGYGSKSQSRRLLLLLLMMMMMTVKMMEEEGKWTF